MRARLILLVGWAIAASILQVASFSDHAAAVGEATFAAQPINRRLKEYTCDAGQYNSYPNVNDEAATAEEDAAAVEAAAAKEAEAAARKEGWTPCVACEIGKASAVEGATSSNVCHWYATGSRY